MSTSLAVFRLLLNAVRPPCLSCDASTSAECFGASPPQLCPCFACWLLSAGSTSELSRSLISSMSLARGAHHCVLDLAPLHSTAAQLGLRGLTVHAHGHVLPGPSELPGLTLLEHLHTQLFLAAWSHWLLWDSQQHFVRLLLAMLIFHGFLGPGPWLVYLWVFGSQPLSVSLSSRPFGTCFIQHSAHTLDVSPSHPPHPKISKSTSPSETQLLFNPWNKLNSDVTGFRNIKPLRRMQIAIFHAHRDVHYSVDVLKSAASPQR